MINLRRLGWLASAFLLVATSAGAQVQVSGAKVFVGGMYAVVTDFDEGVSGIGGIGEVSVPVTDSADVVVGYAYQYYFDPEDSVSQVLAGPRFYAGSSEGSTRPFAHALVGWVFADSYDFVYGGGVGVDVVRSDRWSIRPIQVDFVTDVGADVAIVRFSAGATFRVGS